MSDQIFELETFARNGFTVRHAYVDITDDLIAGILLGQIVYWYLPNEQGKSKLKVKKERRILACEKPRGLGRRDSHYA
ncbi:hypothetical protein ACT7C1_21335 [Bacillus paranthracis]